MSTLKSTQQAAAYCGVSEKRIQKWIESGRLKAVERDGRRWIDAGELEEFHRGRYGLPPEPHAASTPPPPPPTATEPRPAGPPAAAGFPINLEFAEGPLIPAEPEPAIETAAPRTESDHLAHLVERLHRDNMELAARLGYYQAQVQFLEERLRVLTPPPAPAAAVAPEAPGEPIHRRRWWLPWKRAATAPVAAATPAG
jgi:excisionase family DNA binding protein